MKKRLLPVMLLAAGSLLAETHFSIGVGGAPAYYAPAPRVVATRPPCPGPGYTWVDGYRANGAWISGYWAPPYNTYVAPRNPEFRGDRDDHDRDRGRVWDHDRDQDHDRGRDGVRR